MIFIYL